MANLAGLLMELGTPRRSSLGFSFSNSQIPISDKSSFRLASSYARITSSITAPNLHPIRSRSIELGLPLWRLRASASALENRAWGRKQTVRRASGVFLLLWLCQNLLSSQGSCVPLKTNSSATTKRICCGLLRHCRMVPFC